MKDKSSNPLYIARQQAREQRIEQIRLKEKVTIADLQYVYKLPGHELRSLMDASNVSMSRNGYNTQEAFAALQDLTVS